MRNRFTRFSLVLLFVAATFAAGSAFAQGPPPGPPPGPPSGYKPNQTLEPEQPQGDGANAGGKWMVFQTEDPMTAAKLVRYELESDNTMPDSDRHSKIILSCKNGKLEHADFEPSIRMSGPNRPGFWGQPQMEVLVRVDGSHSNHGWNWLGRALSMDKGTTRELIGSHLFRVEFLGMRRQAPPAPQIAEFSPDGLDLSKVHHDCDISPKKP
jgi:hypothetical protein